MEARLLLSVSVSPAQNSTDQGVEAHFYNVAFWSGAPAVSTQAPAVNFTWPDGSPDPAIRLSNNSSVFTGKIHTDAAGTYTFVGNTDDDGYLYVNGQLVSSDPGAHEARNATSVHPISLAANSSYDFVFLRSHGTGPAAARMLWIEPGGTGPVVVPTSQLTPVSDSPGAVTNLTMDTLSALSPNPNPHGIDLVFDSDNVAVVRYELERSSDGGATWDTVAQADPQGSTRDPAHPGQYTTRISDASALPDTSYSYRVLARNFDGISPTGGTLSVTTPPLPAQTGGVEARYFNDELASASAGQDPAQITANANPSEFVADQLGFAAPIGSGAPIDASFGGSSPDPTPYPDIPRIHPGDYASLFTGKVHTSAAGTYTFITNTDDDGYLWVNGTLVSSDPGEHSQRDATHLTRISLAASSEYDFVFVQQQLGSDSCFHLSWIQPDGTGGTIPEQLIPAYTDDSGHGLEMFMDPPDKESTGANGSIITDATQPAAANLTLTAMNAAGNTIAWTNQSHSVLWFQIERSGDDGFTYHVVGKRGFDATSFTDTTAVAGTRYFYRVRGMNFDGRGVASNVIDAICDLPTETPVLTAVACVPNEVDLGFTGQSPASGGFELQYHDDTNTTFIDVPCAEDLPNNTSSYAVMGLDRTKIYTFRIRSLPGPTGCPGSPFSNSVTASAAGGPVIDYSTGFTGQTGLQLNGSASIATEGAHDVLQLTPAQSNQVGSAFFNQQDAAAAFDTTFDFQFNQGAGDPGGEGFTFVLQGGPPTALGSGGASLGYEGIAKSVAVKFDLSPSVTTTGLYINGHAPDDALATAPGIINQAYDMSGSGINWHANFADVFRAHLSYDGMVLSETVADLVTNAVFTMSWELDIPQIIGSNCAYVGFTGATGTSDAEQDIESWRFAPLSPLFELNRVFGTSGNDTITIKVDPRTPNWDDAWVNVPVTAPATWLLTNKQTIEIIGGGGNDTLIIDSSNGQPIPLCPGLELFGSFTLDGTFPMLDSAHPLDMGSSTLNIPYSGTSILPAVQSALRQRAIVSSIANPSPGKYAIADSDNGSQVTLKYTLVGDVNEDGRVNFSDLLTLAQNYDQTGTDWSHGDLTYDGAVGFADLLALGQHYGQSSAMVVAVAAINTSSTDSFGLLLGRKSRRRDVVQPQGAL